MRPKKKLLSRPTRLPARIVIDLGRWERHRDAVEALSGTIEATVLPVPNAWPVALVVTAAQFRWLPRTLEERDDRLRIVQCADAAACERKARELAGSRALVIAPWRHDPFELWAALSWNRPDVTLSPPDAIATFARDGLLTRLPRPAKTLSAMGIEASPSHLAHLPPDGPEVRMLMVSLSSADGALKLNTGAPARLAMAQALGIEAAATTREQVEWEIAQLAEKLRIKVDMTSAANGRDSLIARAARRAVEPGAFRVGDEIHVVAPLSAVSKDLRTHPRLRLHRVRRHVPAIVRLREALISFTPDHFLDDPFLEALIRELDPTGVDYIPFAHARSALFGATPTAFSFRPSTPASDWREALASLTDPDLPSTGLRVTLDGDLAVNTAPYLGDRANLLFDLATLPAPESLLLAPGQPLSVFSNESRRNAIPLEVEAWQDHLERWQAGHAKSSPDPQTGATSLGVHAAWDADAPDALAGLAWMALRRAVGSQEVVRRRDGVMQVHVGGGVSLIMSLRSHARRDGSSDVRAALMCGHKKWTTGDVLFLTRHTSLGVLGNTGAAGWDLPRGFYVSGANYAVDVRFAFAPWLVASGLSPQQCAPVLRRLRESSATASAQAAAERDDDYDD